MKWGDLFQNPDRVGQAEYLAVHDAITTALGGEPGPGVDLSSSELELISSMLDEFKRISRELKRKVKEIDEIEKGN